MSVYFHDILKVYKESVNGFKSSTRHIQTQIITLQGLSVLNSNRKGKLQSFIKWQAQDVWDPMGSATHPQRFTPADWFRQLDKATQKTISINLQNNLNI